LLLGDLLVDGDLFADRLSLLGDDPVDPIFRHQHLPPLETLLETVALVSLLHYLFCFLNFLIL